MARLRVDAAPPDEARVLLRSCCGSSAWVARMMARRPFGGQDAMHAAAREEWFALTPSDWLEAFAQHPKIGDREALRQRFAETRLAAQEQSGVERAREDVLAALAAGNDAYEKKFGYIFIVCASGLTAEEMLSMLTARLTNDPAAELRVAAEEQARITALRLNTL